MNVKTEKIKFQLQGITCSGCAEDMENILLDKDGVADVSVNYSDGTVLIEYEPDAVNEEELYTAVKRLGFKTHISRE